jgi:hypothetical protein
MFVDSCSIASLEDVLSEIVDRVQRSNLPDVNHTFCQNWDNAFHQELSHVLVIKHLEMRHVILHVCQSDLHGVFYGCLVLFHLLFGLFVEVLVSLCFVFLFFKQVFFSLFVQKLNGFEVVVRSSESFDVDAHALKHLVLVSLGVDLEDLCLVLLEELGVWEFIRLSLEVLHVVKFLPSVDLGLHLGDVPFVKVLVAVELLGSPLEEKAGTMEDDY